MTKSQTALIINTQNIQVNDIFPSITALFVAVANKPRSSGKTRKSDLGQLFRYLEYR